MKLHLQDAEIMSIQKSETYLTLEKDVNGLDLTLFYLNTTIVNRWICDCEGIDGFNILLLVAHDSGSADAMSIKSSKVNYVKS